MTIGFGTAGALTVTTTGSNQPALPGSLAAGDLMIAHESVQTSTTMGTPAGWNVLGSPIANAESPVFLMHLYWRFATASETAPTFSSAGAAVMAGVISRFTAVPVGLNPFNVAATTHQGSGASMAGNSDTTTVDQCLALWFWSQDDNGVTSTVTNSATVGYGGSSYNTTTGGGTNCSLAYKLITPAGSTGATAMTTASGTQNMHLFAVLDPTPPPASLPPLLRPEQVRVRHLVSR